MSDEVREDRSAASRRMSERRAERIVATESAYRSWQDSGSAALRERALMREWTVRRNAAGREVVDGALYDYVRNNVRQLAWARATGQPDVKLEGALRFFLSPDRGSEVSAKDYVEAAYRIAAYSKSAPQAPAANSDDAKSRRESAAQKSGQSSAALTPRARAEIARLMARREAVAARISAITSVGRQKGDASVLQELRVQFAHLNNRLAELQAGHDNVPAPSQSVDTASSQTAAARDLQKSLGRLSASLDVARNAGAKGSTQTQHKPGVVEAARAFLRHALEYGLRLRNNMVALDIIHPGLKSAIHRVIARQ